MMIPSYSLAGWLVLVIDDEFDSREVASLMLQQLGAKVITAENGEQALQLLDYQRPAFILSDLSMPIVDGWQLINRLIEKGVTQDTPVFALTAHAMVGDRERVISAGFRNYIDKPLDITRFLQQLLLILREQPEFIGRF